MFRAFIDRAKRCWGACASAYWFVVEMNPAWQEAQARSLLLRMIVAPTLDSAEREPKETA